MMLRQMRGVPGCGPGWLRQSFRWIRSHVEPVTSDGYCDEHLGECLEQVERIVKLRFVAVILLFFLLLLLPVIQNSKVRGLRSPCLLYE